MYISKISLKHQLPASYLIMTCLLPTKDVTILVKLCFEICVFYRFLITVCCNLRFDYLLVLVPVEMLLVIIKKLSKDGYDYKSNSIAASEKYSSVVLRPLYCFDLCRPGLNTLLRCLFRVGASHLYDYKKLPNLYLIQQTA